MYANAELTAKAIQNRQPATSTRERISVRETVNRFLNWFGSGGVAPHLVKADQAHGTNFILIHGHIVPDRSCREATGADKYTR